MPASDRRPRLSFAEWPAAIYAIGDVHGCLDQLQKLEAEIVADGAAIPGEKWIVTLGDYVDRGGASPAVLDHVMSPAPPSFKRFALIGNHEQLLLDFLDNPAAHVEWLEWGGLQTARAYGMPEDPRQSWRRQPNDYGRQLRRLVPPRHVDFLKHLPTCIRLPGFFFVHAGIRPGVPLDAQDDEDLIWIRAPFLKAELSGELMVVHGHTPVDAVEFVHGRVDIDTGCFFSGVLTALRVLPDGSMRVLQARGEPSDYMSEIERQRRQ